MYVTKHIKKRLHINNERFVITPCRKGFPFEYIIASIMYWKQETVKITVFSQQKIISSSTGGTGSNHGCLVKNKSARNCTHMHNPICNNIGIKFFAETNDPIGRSGTKSFAGPCLPIVKAKLVITIKSMKRN